MLATGSTPQPIPLGIAWLALTLRRCSLLAWGKRAPGEPRQPGATDRGRVTVIDALLAGAVLPAWCSTRSRLVVGRSAAGLVIVYYAVREARTIYAGQSAR